MATQTDDELAAMVAAYEVLKDLTPEEQGRVVGWLSQKLSVGGIERLTAGRVQGWSVSSGPTAVTTSSAKAFLVEKRPSTDVERVTCLAYFLSHYANTPEFKTKDITKLNKEAAQPRMSNAAKAVNNATTHYQYLAAAGGGRKQITTRGEAVVEALPERERVREAIESNPMVGRKKRRVKNPQVGKQKPG